MKEIKGLDDSLQTIEVKCTGNIELNVVLSERDRLRSSLRMTWIEKLNGKNKK